MCLKVQVYQCTHPSGVRLRSYIIIMGLVFTLGTLAQVGAYPKEIGNTVRNPLDQWRSQGELLGGTEQP